MKIGVAADNHLISEHFGQSNALYIYELNNDDLSYQLDIKQVKPHQEGSFPDMIIKENIDVIICGGLGMKAKHKFDDKNIQVIAGAHGDIQTIFNLFLRDELKSTDQFCTGHHH